ncbi:MAG: hypothetical protein JXR94_11215 [Candidatus Hydrogenedentes bacterium]|nr:hypothetical protein [Candidatus Hydrogenedentota bacterium]
MRGLYERISPRERRLATGAASVILIGLVYLLALQAFARLDALDLEIEGLQQDLLYAARLAEQAEGVDAVFDAIAAEHSSQWSQEEIHDRLRREISRLAAKNAPPQGEVAPQGSPMLVDIRSLPSGLLDEGGEGYRQYHIEFRTEPAPIQNLAVFLERLQESPQALRIDRVDLKRPPQAGLFTATIAVTRTVIDDAAPGGGAPGPAPAPAQMDAPAPAANRARNPSFEQWDGDEAGFPEWQSEGLVLTQGTTHASDGAACLAAHARQPGGILFQLHELEAGATYDLYADILATGRAQLSATLDESGAPLESPVELDADGARYRYHVRFTVPGAPGTRVLLRAPCIVLEGDGKSLFLDNVVLMAGEV